MSLTMNRPATRLVLLLFGLTRTACSSEHGQAAAEPSGGEAGVLASPVAGAGSAGSAAEGGEAGTASETPDPQPRAGTVAAPDTAGADATPPPAVAEPEIQRSTVGANTAPSISDADYAAFISQINEFGLDLGQQYASSNELTRKNIIYSPLSVTHALGMTYAGARGQTAAEMKAVLGDTFADGVFHTANNRLARELASRVTSRPDTNGNAHKIELSLADAIFVDRTVTLQAPFLDLLSREYDSGARRVDFLHAFEPARLTINAWVEEQTRDRIQDLLPQGSVDALTRLVLVNAIYFYGSWAVPFRSESTRDAVFTPLGAAAIRVPTMNGQFRSAYRATDQFAVAELPYEGGKLRMTIVLPAAGQFEMVRSQVSAAWLERTVSNLEETLLHVSLPKFELTVGTLSLTTGLKALGVKTAFERAADFSGITATKVGIADVVHKAFIAVDENGTEAAAATAVILTGTSAPVDPPTPFTVDRPFLFFIRDSSGPVLFMGQVVDPTKH